MSEEIEINLKDLIKNKHFWPAIITIIFLITRLPFINANQAVWWDEAQYTVMTKSLFLGTPTTGWWNGRSIIYPWMLYTLTFPLGYNELAIKFINLLFGLGFTLAGYYLIKELMNEKYAIMTGLIMASQWVFHFWNTRITIDIPSAFFITLSALLFMKDKRTWSGITLGLAFSIRFTAGITGISYLIYDLINKKEIKKYNWILGALIGITPLLIHSMITYGNPLESIMTFLTFNLESSGGSQAGDQLFYLQNMTLNYGIIMGVLVFLGIIPLIFNLKKSKHQFITLNIILYLIFYSVITQVKEVRFLIHLLPFITASALLGASLIINSTVRNKKTINMILTVITLIILTENLITGIPRIQSSSESYLDVRLAGEWLKDKTGTVISNSVPQITYYSEKETQHFPETLDELLNNNASWIIVSVYEPHPTYAYELELTPLKAYPEPQNARLIIYLKNNTN